MIRVPFRQTCKPRHAQGLLDFVRFRGWVLLTAWFDDTLEMKADDGRSAEYIYGSSSLIDDHTRSTGFTTEGQEREKGKVNLKKVQEYRAIWCYVELVGSRFVETYVCMLRRPIPGMTSMVTAY